jgi:hypothetical protein
MIKSRMRWAGHVARTGRWKIRIKLVLESFTGKIHSEDIGIDGRMVLKCILVK